MGRLYIVFFVILLAISVASAAPSSIDASYDIQDRVRVSLSMSLSETPFILPIPADVQDFSLEGAAYTLEDKGDFQELTITEPGAVALSYDTEAYLEKTDDDYFILDLMPLHADSLSISVLLPEQGSLKHSTDAPQPSAFPAGYEVGTDGQRISVAWSNIQDEDAMMIVYQTPDTMSLWWLVWMLLAVLFAFGIFKLLNRKKKGDLTRNLFEEEKKIVEVLLAAPKKELWQKELQRKTDLTKVKLTRKLRNLEQKGLIEKVPYGNANKIRLKEASK